MLLTTQQWLGTTCTMSPTLGRSAQAERSTMPCSSERLATTASGYSMTWPKPFWPYWSEVSTLVPQSRMARPSVGRLTTVARTRMAQLSQVAVPEETTMTSLNTQVPARCSVSMGMLCAVKMLGVPPPETTGTGIPAPLKRPRASVTEPQRGVSVYADAPVTPVQYPRLAQIARHHVVVEDHGQPRRAPHQGHEPIGLGPAENVVAEENVVGHPRLHAHLDLPALLAGEPHGPRLHLHLPDGGDLVGLDVRPVADAVAGEVRLHPADVVLHDGHVHGDGGRVEITDGGHGRLSSSGTSPSQARRLPCRRGANPT